MSVGIAPIISTPDPKTRRHRAVLRGCSGPQEPATGQTSRFPGLDVQRRQAVVHIVDISKTDEQQKPDSGGCHHVAFASSGFAGISSGLSPRVWRSTSGGCRALPSGRFSSPIPNGVMLELNYEMANEQG